MKINYSRFLKSPLAGSNTTTNSKDQKAFKFPHNTRYQSVLTNDAEDHHQHFHMGGQDNSTDKILPQLQSQSFTLQSPSMTLDENKYIELQRDTISTLVNNSRSNVLSMLK